MVSGRSACWSTDLPTRLAAYSGRRASRFHDLGHPLGRGREVRDDRFRIGLGQQERQTHRGARAILPRGAVQDGGARARRDGAQREREPVDVRSTADAMLAECESVGQSARRVPAEAADDLRVELRAKAREQQMRIRTAQMDDVVVVARVDASLWNDDTAMRAKLAPPD